MLFAAYRVIENIYTHIITKNYSNFNIFSNFYIIQNKRYFYLFFVYFSYIREENVNKMAFMHIICEIT